MIAPIFTMLTYLAVLASGLMAGLFFIFSNTIMAALARLPAAQGIAAMQSLNVVILNGVFLAVFMGTAVLSVVLGIKAVIGWNEAGSAWLLIGGVLYLVGCLGVTMLFNVPLNDALLAVDPASTEGAVVWTRYLAEWVPWNHVRTVASLAALASFAAALRWGA